MWSHTRSGGEGDDGQFDLSSLDRIFSWKATLTWKLETLSYFWSTSYPWLRLEVKTEFTANKTVVRVARGVDPVGGGGGGTGDQFIYTHICMHNIYIYI